VSASLRGIVERLGPHPSRRAGLDPTQDAGALPWLALALLLSARADEEHALAAWRDLAAHELADVAALSAADPAQVAARLALAHVPQPERAAATLLRACRAFVSRFEGSLARLVADADDLDSLGARVTSLAPGVGTATVLRFLRPLRERFAVARELPLAPSARAAAVHLGLLTEDEDEEGAPARLRARALSEPDAPPFADVEAALERLGTAACLRGRSDRCPLGNACPLRRSEPSGS
jgi:hypothetical protein